jgi:hypothetical protein
MMKIWAGYVFAKTAERELEIKKFAHIVGLSLKK